MRWVCWGSEDELLLGSEGGLGAHSIDRSPHLIDRPASIHRSMPTGAACLKSEYHRRRAQPANGLTIKGGKGATSPRPGCGVAGEGQKERTAVGLMEGSGWRRGHRPNPSHRSIDGVRTPCRDAPDRSVDSLLVSCRAPHQERKGAGRGQRGGESGRRARVIRGRDSLGASPRLLRRPLLLGYPRTYGPPMTASRPHPGPE